MIVLNHLQTKDLIEGGKAFGHGKAYASGSGVPLSSIPLGPARDSLRNSPSADLKVKTVYSKNETKPSTETGDTSQGSKKLADATEKNTDATQDNTSKLDKFQQWLDSLKDWIEVRISRLTYKMEMAITKSENLGGIGDKTEKLSRIGDKKKTSRTSTASDMNDYINEAMKINKKLRKDNRLGAEEYLSYASKVAKRAQKAGLITKAQRKELVPKIQKGKISIQDFSQYIKKNSNGSDSKKTENTVKTFIDAYTEWYEKMLDCKKAQEECIAKAKELQQQKIDNIVEQYETLAEYASSVQSTSEAFVKVVEARGRAVVNSDIVKNQMGEQYKQQNYTTGYLKQSLKELDAEMKNAKKVFGENSNQYHEVMIKRNEMEQKMNESIAAAYDIRKQMMELDIEANDNLIERIKGIASLINGRITLSEKRDNENTEAGTTNPGHYIDLYSSLVDRNNAIIETLDKQRTIAAQWIGKNQHLEGSTQYQEQYKAYIDAEQQILDIMGDQEDIKKKIHDYRWKSFEELEKELNKTQKQLDDIMNSMRDAEFFDTDFGINLTSKGYANIMLLADGIAEARRETADYDKALKKLQQDYDNHNITQDELNEKTEEYENALKSASDRIDGYQEKLVSLYKTQIQNENDLLQKNITARKNALAAKKEYYDYDKSLKDSSKDITNIQAQINSLQNATDSASQAKLVKLQQQLKEAQDDREDTLYNHQIEVRQEGYDKLAEDATNVLNETMRELDGNQATRDSITQYMLDQLDGHETEANKAIDEQIKTRGLIISQDTKDFMNKYSKERITQKTWEDNVDKKVLDIETTQIPTLNTTTDRIGKEITAEVNKNIEQTRTTGDITNTKLGGIETALSSLKSEYEATQKEMKSQIKEGVTAGINNSVVAKGIPTDGSNTKATEDSTPSTNTTTVDKSKLTQEQIQADEWAKVKGELMSLYGSKDKKISFDDKNKTFKVEQTLEQMTKDSSGRLVSMPTTHLYEAGDLEKAKKLVLEAGLKTKTENKKEAVKTTAKKAETKANVANATSAKVATVMANKGLQLKNGKLIVKSTKKEASLDIYKEVLKALGEKYNKKTYKSVVKNKLSKLGYRKGSFSTDDELNWLHDNEVVIRKSDGAILQPFNSGDMVFTSKMSENLWKMAQIPTETVKAMVANPDMSKFSMPSITDKVNNTQNNNQQIHFDSLITINGNADQQTVADIREIAEQLIKSRDFGKNMTNVVTKNMTREAAKAGYRGK